jgi:DNA modification methylase
LQTSADARVTPQNEIIWSYNWGGRAKNNFARKHEYAWCWSKGKEFLFNDAEIRVERKLKKNIRTGEDYAQGTIPTCIWEKNNHTTSKEFCGWHPTTKNLEVLERMIRAYTNPDDCVLDIFMGSGSTAIAANNCNRNYLGCERDEEYYSKSLERIEEQKTLVKLAQASISEAVLPL